MVSCFLLGALPPPQAWTLNIVPPHPSPPHVSRSQTPSFSGELVLGYEDRMSFKVMQVTLTALALVPSHPPSQFPTIPPGARGWGQEGLSWWEPFDR